MPRNRTNPPSTIHRTHLSYQRNETYGCVNVHHDKIDCYSAGLQFSAYCEPCTRHSLRNNPKAKCNDATYVLDYGEGYTLLRFNTFGGVPVYEPVWVWRCWEVLDYTAPHHVAEALWEYAALATEIEMAEAAAGWDLNP